MNPAPEPLTGPSSVPYLTPETFPNATPYEQVKCLSDKLTDREKMQLIREWIKPMVEEAEARFNKLSELEALL